MQSNNNEVIDSSIPNNTLNTQSSNNWNSNNIFNSNSNNNTNNPKMETWKKVLIGIGIFFAIICIIGIFSDEENSEFVGTYIKTRNSWNHTVDSYIEITEDKLTYVVYGLTMVDASYTIDKKNKQIKADDFVFGYEIDDGKVSCIYRIGNNGVAMDYHYRADYY